MLKGDATTFCFALVEEPAIAIEVTPVESNTIVSVTNMFFMVSGLTG
jgi:hypothetical protein